jgi:hypothetical protein
MARGFDKLSPNGGVLSTEWGHRAPFALSLSKGWPERVEGPAHVAQGFDKLSPNGGGLSTERARRVPFALSLSKGRTGIRSVNRP